MLMELAVKSPEWKEKIPPTLIRSEHVKYIRYSQKTARTDIVLAHVYEDREVVKSIPDAHFEKRQEFLTKGLRKALFIVAEHKDEESAFIFAVDPMRIVAIRAEPAKKQGLFTVFIDLDHLPPSDKKDVGVIEVGDMTWEETDAFQTGWRDYIFRRARDEGARRTTELIVASQAPR